MTWEIGGSGGVRAGGQHVAPPVERQGRQARWIEAPDAASATAVAAPIVIELQVRLRLEGDEEAEREVPVRSLIECEGRAPVVHVALQRHDVAGELRVL